MRRNGDYTQKSDSGEELNKKESITIPVVEERLKVGKKTVETGKVLIHKKVTEEEVSVEVPIVQEEIEVKRVEVNKYLESSPPAVRYEGDTMVIPVLQEVIEKRLLLVEEVHVTKRKVHVEDTQKKVTLRKEEVNVERIKGSDINK